MTAKPLLGLFIIASLALTSCKQELQPQESSTTGDALAPAETTAATPATAPTVTPTQAPNVAVNPGQVTSAQPAKAAKGMNPAHGQPGHRCDIPVGAPLNSPPGKANQAQAATPTPGKGQVIKMNPTATAGSTTITPSQAPGNVPAILQEPGAATAPGMNPPHGQAGHRCDVAVGAPLPKS